LRTNFELGSIGWEDEREQVEKSWSAAHANGRDSPTGTTRFFLLSYLFFYEFTNIYIALNVLQNHTYAAIWNSVKS
jgi:hypothetical protein